MIQEKILVVEDDIQIQNFMVYTLENAGFEVAAVPSGKEAIECMIIKDIDLILLDLGLPDMDGMDVLHKVREWSGVPIIIVSARDQDKEKVTALDDGADDYCEDTQVLRSVMASTGRKIENNPAKPEYILTEIGICYCMR